MYQSSSSIVAMIAMLVLLITVEGQLDHGLSSVLTFPSLKRLCHCRIVLLSSVAFTVEICTNFYSGLLKNFLAIFGSIFNFFFDTQIIFLKKLFVSNFFSINFILGF